MPAPKFPNQSSWTGTKRSFIASMPSSMPNEIVAAGKERGLKLTLAHVYAVRSLERRKANQNPKAKRPKAKAKAAPSGKPGPAARSRRVRRTRPSGPSPKASSRKPRGNSRTASGRRGQLDLGGLLPGLVMIGGYRYAEEIAALQVKHGFAEPVLEAMLKAASAMLGLPRAIKILSTEQERVEQSILEAFR